MEIQEKSIDTTKTTENSNLATHWRPKTTEKYMIKPGENKPHTPVLKQRLLTDGQCRAIYNAFEVK
jgi:hypothetical protein